MGILGDALFQQNIIYAKFSGHVRTPFIKDSIITNILTISQIIHIQGAAVGKFGNFDVSNFIKSNWPNQCDFTICTEYRIQIKNFHIKRNNKQSSYQFNLIRFNFDIARAQ